MTSLLVLSMTVLAQLPLPNRAELTHGSESTLQADTLVYDTAQEVLVAQGHAVLHTPEAVVRADELTYDQAHDLATAKGHVLLVSGQFAAIAEEARVDLTHDEVTVERGMFMTKKGISPQALSVITTAEELKAAGKTTAVVSGKHIKKLGPDHYEVDGLSFTPCDCDPTKPSWNIKSASGDVKVNDRAILNWPVIYVRGVPVFAFPWMYLPLEDRKTGLLFPHPLTSAQNGFSFDQPVFFTLGPSYDLTLTPGYYFGAGDTTYTAPSDLTAQTGQTTVRGQSPVGVKGPRLEGEFRYVPSRTTFGRVSFGGFFDFKRVRDPIDPNAFDVDPYNSDNGVRPLIGDSRRGLRGEMSWSHTQELGNGWFDRVEASGVSDGYYPKDLTADILLRENQYLRSSGTVFRRTQDTYLGGEVVLRQDLRWGYGIWGDDHRYGDPTQPLSRGPNTFQRLPAIRYAIPEKPLLGPLFGSLGLEYTRLSPLRALFGDEGQNGLFDVAKFNASASNPSYDPLQGNGRFDPGEREARDRLDLRPKLSTVVPLGTVAQIEPFAAYRQDVYVTEITHQTFQRGYPLLGADVQTELSRPFGASGQWRHSIVPRVAFRYVPGVVGNQTFVPYDEIDSAISSQHLAQAVLDLDQRLFLRTGNVANAVLRVDAGQDLDVHGGKIQDTYGRLTFSLPPIALDAIGRYNFPQKRTTQLSTSLTFTRWPRGVAYVRFDHLVTDGSDPLRGGIDELFGSPSGLPPCPPAVVGVTPTVGLTPCRESAETLNVGGQYRFQSGLGLTYDAIVQTMAFPPVVAPNTQQPFYNHFAQQTVGVFFAPACDCWRAELHAIFRPLAGPTYRFATPDIGFSLTLARFGSFGTGR